MRLPDGRVERRCKRYNTPRHAHALTFSCQGKAPLLLDPSAREALGEAFNASRSRHDFALWAYVFMPDHVHALIYPRRAEYSISDILRSIKQPTARRCLASLRARNDPWLERLRVHWPNGRTCLRFWAQGGGYDRNITSERAVRSEIEYIEANPVRKGVVIRGDEWKWSSAAARLRDDHPLRCDSVNL